MLILYEYARDWADDATIRWFYDTAAVLAAAGEIEPPAGGDQLLARWRSRHTVDGARCHGGDAMIRAVSVRLGNVTVRRVPMADGALPATAFRLAATKHAA